MTYDDAVKALSNDAVKLVKNNQTIGLGSGRSATAFVKSLSLLVKKKKINIKCVPTSLQIKLEAEKGKLHLIEAVLDKIDIVFDGADQIDKEKNLIKNTILFFLSANDPTIGPIIAIKKPVIPIVQPQ